MGTEFIEDEMKQYIEKMEVGDRIVTKSRVISRTDCELFAIMTGAAEPMFLAEEAAKAVGWKAQLVPGLLSYSIAIGLLIQSGFIADVKAYMGTDKMKFPAPVHPGDTIRVETELLSKKQTSKGDWVCSYKWMIKNQDDETTAEGENT